MAEYLINYKDIETIKNLGIIFKYKTTESIPTITISLEDRNLIKLTHPEISMFRIDEPLINSRV